MTRSRCIDHTDQTLSKDYKSTTTLTILDPQRHREYRDQKDKPPGPRQAMMEARIKAIVDGEINRKRLDEFEGSQQRTYTTATAAAHDIPGFKPFF